MDVHPIITAADWQRLADRNIVAPPPAELLPLPPGMSPDESDARIHAACDITPDDTTPTTPTAEQACALLNFLATAEGIRLSGYVRFPAWTETRDLDLPDVATSEWGMPESVQVTPRVPLPVACDGETWAAAVSTTEALTVDFGVAGESAPTTVARVLAAIVDPDGAWAAAEVPRRMVPAGEYVAVCAGESESSVVADYGGLRADVAVDVVVRSTPPRVMSHPDQVKKDVPAGGLWARLTGEAGAVVCYPGHDRMAGNVVVFEPATSEAVGRMVAALAAMSDNPAWAAQWRSEASGGDSDDGPDDE